MPQPLINPKEYKQLLSAVKATLIDGQTRIEHERVRTYWETGRIIYTNILKNKDRAEYGSEVAQSLANDLNIEVSTIQRCIKFAKAYPQLPIVGSRPQFRWSHYRKFIAISDDKLRSQLEKETARNKWTSDELGLRIKDIHPMEEPVEPAVKSVSTKAKSTTPLVPLRGELYTYRVVKRPTLGVGEDASDLLLDLGFGVFRNCDKALGAFSDGDIVVSQPKNDAYKFASTTKTAKDLFTYNAFVERVIDGDTIKVRLDLGFDTWVRETLRLRGIDAPEMDTKEGQAAKTFVQSYVKEAQQIVVRSSRSDKYDRYLADVFFIPPQNVQKGDEDIPRAPIGRVGTTSVFLNNVLLEHNHAVRWE